MADLITWDSLATPSRVFSFDGLTILSKGAARATENKASGKWYWEVKHNNSVAYQMCGICSDDFDVVDFNMSNLTPRLGLKAYESHRGYKMDNSAFSIRYAPASRTLPQTIGIKLNLETGVLGFFLNGSYLGDAFADLSTSMPGGVYAVSGVFDSASTMANFGAAPFDIATSNPSAWEQLVSEGYLPYDYENAKWFKKERYLFQQNNNILTYDTDISDWKIIGNNTSNLNDLFEEHGTNDIDHIDKTKLNQLSKPIKILCREEK